MIETPQARTGKLLMNAILPKKLASSLFSEPGVASDMNIGLYEAWRLIVRRKWTLIAIVVAILGGTYAVLSYIKPVYTATATVMLDPRQERVVNIDSVLSGLTQDASMIDSEVEVIRSRNIARRVIEETGLLEREEFNPALAGGLPIKARIRELLATSITALSQATGVELPLSLVTEEPADPMIVAIDLFDEHLGVSPVGRSRVIAISFSSIDAELAARVANRVAEAYMLQQMQAKFDVTQKATNWLNTRVDELKAASEASNQAVENFRIKSGLVRGENTLLISEQISRLNADFVTARSAWQTAQSRVESIQVAIKRDGPKAVLNYYDSPTLAELRRVEAELQRRHAQLSNELGPKHPQLASVREQLDSTNRRFAVEANEALARARNEADVARKRMEATQASLDGLKNDLAHLSGSEVQLRALEQEASANRAIYETFLNRLKQTEQLGFVRPESWTVSTADVPRIPSFPKKVVVLPVALLLGLVAGLLVIFGAELFETGIRSVEEAEQRLQIPALGMVPAIRALSKLKYGVAGTVDRQPNSAFTEAYRSILTTVLIGQSSLSGGRVILLTSALPGEGKTTSILALAKVAARNGYRVLVIDADLHRCGLSIMLNAREQLGISDYLEGQAELDQVIRSENEHLHVIPAGTIRRENQRLLRSPRFDEMFTMLRGHYDLILVDTPPVLPVSDVKILINYADCCIHVVRWRQTRARTAAFAVKELLQSGATLQGTIVMQADTRQHSLQTSSDAERYSKACASYYGKVS